MLSILTKLKIIYVFRGTAILSFLNNNRAEQRVHISHTAIEPFTKQCIYQKKMVTT